MTEDLVKGGTEFRPWTSKAGKLGAVDVLPGDRSKGWRRKGLADGTERNSMELRKWAGDGDSGNNYDSGKAAGELGSRAKDSWKGRTKPSAENESFAPGKKQQQQQQKGELPKLNREAEVMSLDGDRGEMDDGSDDGEGDVAQVAPGSQPKQKPPQPPPPQQQQQKKSSVAAAVAAAEKLPNSQLKEAQVPVSSVGWESFLPQRNIRVLLAEDDDSTRQVVGALLRNCSYEVSSVANGMHAWEMLEDANNHFDLVLTDVVMPCLSGVGLLTKIMSKEGGKRIPVIMMSSHDSTDIVFRCLSKGAADFLVKPLRKNELKNLWQHVWRCQSSSGSGSGGSGSGSGPRKVVRARSRVGSGNNSGSNEGSEDNTSGLNVRGGSDNGSGTQAVVHVNHKLKRDKADGEEGQATSLQNSADNQMGQDLEMATRRPLAVDMEKGKGQSVVEATKEDPPSTSGNSGNKLEKDFDSGSANSGGCSAKAIDLIGGIAFRNKEDVEEGGESDGAEGLDRGASNSPANDKCVTSSDSPPLLELSLKRPRDQSEEDKQELKEDERRVLRHSGGSAFSRYSVNGTATIHQLPTGSPISFAGYPMAAAYGPQSLGPMGNRNGQVHFPAAPLTRVGSSKDGPGSLSKQQHPHHHHHHHHPRASHVGNGQDVGSSIVGSSVPEGNSQQVKDEAASVPPIPMQGIPMTIPIPRGMMFDGVSVPYGAALPHIFYSGAAPWASAGPAAHLPDREVFPAYQDHVSHTNRHPAHPQHRPRPPQPTRVPQQEEQVIINEPSGAPKCASSNMPDGNAGQSGSSICYGSTGNGNGSVNGSGSGSNYANNQNGHSCVALNTPQNAECANNGGVAGSGGGPSNGVFGPEQNRSARREAALNKFRQKRKERCFEKKVRYQSRKRLAEQRPRVKGQFVRQVMCDSNAGAEMVD